MSGFCDLCKVPLELAANRDKLIAQREREGNVQKRKHLVVGSNSGATKILILCNLHLSVLVLYLELFYGTIYR